MVSGRGTRFVIIANPTAGRRDSAVYARKIARLLQAGGAESTVAFTTRRGDAERIATKALGESLDESGARLCVVACGGDGTMQEVVNALAREPGGESLLGLAPAGRCNDFASALGVRRDAEQVAEVLLAGKTRPVDVGKVNDRYFCTVAALGFDAAVSRFVNDMRMPLRGTIAYLYGALRVLLVYRPVVVSIACDDAPFDGPVFLVASANTSSYGGQMRIAPDASPFDGMLDLCVVSVLSRRRVLRLIRRVVRGEHAGLPEVSLVRTRSVRIESSERQEIWADGELIGATPAAIEVVPGAVRVVVPASFA